MSEDKTKRLTVYLPDRLKSDLNRMAEETGLSMTQLIVMATHGLVANYKANGGGLFASLIEPGRKEQGVLAERMAVVNRERSDMQMYYGARAREFESIYERDDTGYQAELALLADRLANAVRDRSVLELACGTGYWTERAYPSASSVTAVDIRPEVIEIAEEKRLPAPKVRFRLGDAYEPEDIPGSFDAGVACFWFLHIPKNKIEPFLDKLHARLGSGAVVFMADNVYVEGRGGELIVKEDSEDTYKRRVLADGSQHEILKNYYNEDELKQLFEPISLNLTVFVGQSFWYVTYVTP
ncbi:methyltransferase domain-containing protein [Paenibacillus ginsengarvi]|uniref:Methyltransferase domain-containing protein n=1 Tax=Paenibacillus ginsengarvi TaxID=400777 RepID=A0A3B0CM71_9BACL|nr:methyltransferase domain-containing protein [Paenibacillus ginsengarvi]RKN85477.1 methyltransferase domain-containing protein [Paenibacillus ginsengarvi]